ncbi:MAG: riboflavin biosynthesis protein RibD [Bdellovibrio sp. CG12_big_fil_rev_8_21_14_0_65_39_13]|nr:MAG: riboflavin biosynthesis protein RibD [Bdellovibrio sp. CG22_combo_CG10-13_8_21_14_all_39_27]PIQ60760.1 MAG: riboflavin biosynthesis protein RibD [Bdellovibrio sp. CG12_big_fil_rev_8_21_14_0_65_39_13]PIR36383.1 MAG: riboflavin biosynthesis protein RibD [Bdellovibrio sp. CG11_big_fil_rev_8_21_14_0_20_39_38]PJB53199.1 MAG: riboflavin biosynthesis protein RibD [Bdellovibrio sp. CG_4_9_14_3_um_filter_39_7]
MNYADQEAYMRECLSLAAQAIGDTSPNPLVGAVIIKNDKIIGKGYHHKSGEPHAEVEAINNCNESVEGATLFCNLEPCCHTNKKTPPCAQFLVEKKIAEVYIGMLDPNPAVAGSGVELLKSQGIKVHVGILEDQARELNKVFIKNMASSLPYVHVKWAQSLNGVFASYPDQDRLMLSNNDSLVYGHKLRKKYDAIMIGRETLNLDNPRLNIRYVDNQSMKNPLKVIIGDYEMMNKESTLLKSERAMTVIVTSSKYEKLIHDNVLFSDAQSIKEIFQALKTKFGIQSLLIEGGMKLINSVLSENLADEISVLVSPEIKQGKVFKLEQNLNQYKAQSKTLGNNVVFEYRKI